MGPILFESYLTFIDADFFGRIGSCGQVGTVQPQVERTFERIKGSLPVCEFEFNLGNITIQKSPKSCTNLSNLIYHHFVH